MCFFIKYAGRSEVIILPGCALFCQEIRKDWLLSLFSRNHLVDGSIGVAWGNICYDYLVANMENNLHAFLPLPLFGVPLHAYMIVRFCKKIYLYSCCSAKFFLTTITLKRVRVEIFSGATIYNRGVRD